MKVSIRDLSKMTGFSPATISNALNHKKGVNRETAEEIFRVARGQLDQQAGGACVDAEFIFDGILELFHGS